MTPLVLAVVAIAVAAVRLRPGPPRRKPGPTPPASSSDARARTWPTVPHRSQQPSARAVAAWCDDIARRVRSGASLRDALTTTPSDAATERATAAVRLAIDRGLPIADAADRGSESGPHLRLALDVIATTSRIGGPSAASIDRVAVLLRQRAGDLDERSSHAAQARLSTHVMTAVPLLMLGALVATDDDVRSAATSRLGAACIVAGLALNALGWWWMNRIVGTTS